MKKITFLFISMIAIQAVYASETEGMIDATYNQSKVCHDDSCSTYGVINWKPSGTQAAVTITDTSITGYAWGNEMGWINMAPSGAGVTVSPTTGDLTGNAWSQASGWINFRPSNSGTLSGGIPIGVTITSTGEFYGWAWNGGPYGGWIKFDCGSAGACVKTDWRKIGDRTGGSTSTPERTSIQGGASYFAPYYYANTGSQNEAPGPSIGGSGTTTPGSLGRGTLNLITKTLKLGSKNTEVTTLQIILGTDKDVYPDGLVTGYFGQASLKAVQLFQIKYNIAKKGVAGYGQVGPKTRAKLNELIALYNRG